MRRTILGLWVLVALVSTALAAPSKTTVAKADDKTHKPAATAEKMTPVANSVKKHTKENTGTLLANRVKDVQEHLKQDKTGKVPVKQLDQMGEKMRSAQGHPQHSVLLKASIDSKPSMNQDTKVHGHEQVMGKIPHAAGQQMDTIPREHYTGHGLKRNEHMPTFDLHRHEGKIGDNYRMYKTAYGNSRSFEQHPSEPHHPKRLQHLDHLNAHARDERSKWGPSEPHRHQSRFPGPDAGEQGMSGRRMYDDAHAYRKPEWMEQSKPEVYRDQYERPSFGHGMMSPMGGRPSFSERDWSRKRPDMPDFGNFHKF